MSKKILVASLISLLLIITAGYLYFINKDYVITITDSQIQEKLAEKFPLTKTYLFIIDVTLTNPRVELKNGSDRVNAGLDLQLNIKVNDSSEPLGGSVDVSSGIIYQPEQGAFYLADPVIDELTVQGIPVQYIEKVTTALTKALTKYYDSHPIYKLKASDAKQMAARLVLQDVVVADKALKVTLGL